MEIAALTGLSYPTVRKAIDQFVAGGWSAIRTAARGRNAGDGRLLSADQDASVRRTICDKRPEQLKMEFALSTRGAVMQFVEREFGVRLSIRATGTCEMLSIISTATSQSRANWMIIDGAFNHERLIQFLQALVRDSKR